MDLAALRIFKAVVEQGGINRAAAKLHRVPSNITTRVRRLEEELETKLFVRDRRRLVLSADGKLLLTYADQLLRLSLEAEMALRNGKPRGTLRIGALESTSATRLPPVLSRYHQIYPDVQIELVTGTSGALVSHVHKQDIEAAFVAEPFRKSAGIRGGTRPHHPENLRPDPLAQGRREQDRDRVCHGMLVPRASGALAGERERATRPRAGVSVLPRDHRLRRCGIRNRHRSSFRHRNSRGRTRDTHHAASEGNCEGPDATDLAYRTSLCHPGGDEKTPDPHQAGSRDFVIGIAHAHPSCGGGRTRPNRRLQATRMKPRAPEPERWAAEYARDG